MPLDIVDLRNFYAEPLGQVARRLLGVPIRKRWDTVTGLSVLGIGYATPYLTVFQGEAERVLAFMPEAQGVVHWPSAGPSATALAITTMLPLPDQSIDRILLVHAIETEESPPELLSEIWRVLSPGGRMIAVVPNRRGLWARMDTTPFGQGQPFSRSQLTGLLRDAMFSPIFWQEALYMPPIPSRMIMGSAAAWERLGASLSLPFSGVHLLEATKLLYRPVAVRKAQRVRARAPVLVPVTAGRTARDASLT
jgi:SAM-dependent methyltransferase